MRDEVLRCGKSPCHSCPYRRDVPGGVWAAHEYEKLEKYDGPIIEQVMNGAQGVFLCHAQPGRLCAGWVAVHDMNDNFAIRLAVSHGEKIAPMVFKYESPVPVFGSGAEAAAHGLAAIDDPSPAAKARIKLLLRKHERLRDGYNEPLVAALEENENGETA